MRAFWPNRDPINEPGFNLLIRGQELFKFDEEKNLYAFVENASVNYIDPDGRFLKFITVGRCTSKIRKWFKNCIKDIPPCTTPANGKCPDESNHYFACEVTRMEKIEECMKKADEMFKACVGVANPVPPPRW